MSLSTRAAAPPLFPFSENSEVLLSVFEHRCGFTSLIQLNWLTLSQRIQVKDLRFFSSFARYILTPP